MLRIVILPAAVSPANIISQKPRGFSITFRIGKYHSGQSPEYHFFVHRRSKHRILSAKIRYLSVFRSYRRQHKFCTAFFLMKPLRRAFFVRHASVGALQGPGCPLPAAHERFVQSDMKKQTLPTCHCEAPKGPWQSREGSHDFVGTCLLSTRVLRDSHVASLLGMTRQSGAAVGTVHCIEFAILLPLRGRERHAAPL